MAGDDMACPGGEERLSEAARRFQGPLGTHVRLTRTEDGQFARIERHPHDLAIGQKAVEW